MTPKTRTLFLLALGAASGFSADHKIAPDLIHTSPDETVNVIVRYKAQPGERHHQFVAERGGRLRSHLGLVRSEAYALRASELRTLSDDPDVEYIAPDRPVKATLDYAEPAINANLALR